VGVLCVWVWVGACVCVCVHVCVCVCVHVHVCAYVCVRACVYMCVWQALVRSIVYAPPTIASVVPSSCGTDGGCLVEVRGASFGAEYDPSFAHLRVNFFSADQCASNATVQGARPAFAAGCDAHLLTHSDASLTFVALPGIGKVSVGYTWADFG
jgi:hypothetical protein